MVCSWQRDVKNCYVPRENVWTMSRPWWLHDQLKSMWRIEKNVSILGAFCNLASWHILDVSCLKHVSYSHRILRVKLIETSTLHAEQNTWFWLTLLGFKTGHHQKSRSWMYVFSFSFLFLVGCDSTSHLLFFCMIPWWFNVSNCDEYEYEPRRLRMHLRSLNFAWQYACTCNVLYSAAMRDLH